MLTAPVIRFATGYGASCASHRARPEDREDRCLTSTAPLRKTRLEVLGKPILIDGEAKRDYGLQLRQLAQVLRSHGLEVVTRVVDPGADSSAIRHEIAANLAAGNDFVLVNYARKALGQPGGGHISPLGAYDALSDSFLIMDVNPNRAPWVWVAADDLIAAMRTFDTVENRGYLLVSDAK